MKKVIALKKFSFACVDYAPPGPYYLPDIVASGFAKEGKVQILMIPENRQTK